MTTPARPTRIRYVILALTVCVAVLLYLDRYCLGFVLPFVRENFRLSDSQTSFLVGAFFYTYAFGQIAGGYLSDRFGTRRMLSLYLAIWSVLTGVTGLATGFLMLVLLRFGCGLFEAGAYPACAGLIRRWFPYERRGLASGFVSIGGRIGGTVAPLMTGYLMVVFMPVSHSSQITDNDVLKPRKLAQYALLQEEKNARFSPVLRHAAPHLQSRLPEQAHAVLLEIALLPEDKEPTADQRARLIETLNALLNQSDLMRGLDPAPLQAELTTEMREWFWPSDPARSSEKAARDNRRILEFLFAGSLRQLYGDAWQPVLMIYGAIGVMLAGVFFWFFRDTPRQHVLCNEAEAELVEAHEMTAAGQTAPMSAAALWRGILTNSGLWASALVQFGTNFGWIFLGSMMPLFMQRIFPTVTLVERGWMAMLPFLAAIPVMIFGGWWTDWITKRYGTYWGRCFPVASTRFAAALAFAACCFLDSPWAITAVLCVFSVTNDMGIPALWAYNLDVGKRNVGLVLGWGNMWGNLGAAVAPSVLGDLVLARFVNFDGNYTLDEAKAGYNAVFLTCAAVFVFIGIVSFFIDATKPIGAPAAADAQ